MSQDEIGLIPISGNNPDRVGDVVFVHGLGGNAYETWHPQGKKSDDNFWLKWLGEDFQNTGIWSLNYSAEPFRWRGNSMPLVDRAAHTLKLLEVNDIGSKPLVFVTHSLGGLLVKQMLHSIQDYGTPAWKLILDQTKGIVFISTPHSGSDLANWVKHISGILQPTISVSELVD
jgi:triacylglycerol esterase/lipase EstA (alpha/beta hydrolase family)